MFEIDLEFDVIVASDIRCYCSYWCMSVECLHNGIRIDTIRMFVSIVEYSV